MNDRAMRMIVDAFQPFKRRGQTMGQITLYASPESKLRDREIIVTPYGSLTVQVNAHLPKGKAYLMSNPEQRPRGLEWIR